jgi:hypothetical protein
LHELEKVTPMLGFGFMNLPLYDVFDDPDPNDTSGDYGQGDHVIGEGIHGKYFFNCSHRSTGLVSFKCICQYLRN